MQRWNTRGAALSVETRDQDLIWSNNASASASQNCIKYHRTRNVKTAAARVWRKWVKNVVSWLRPVRRDGRVSLQPNSKAHIKEPYLAYLPWRLEDVHSVSRRKAACNHSAGEVRELAPRLYWVNKCGTEIREHLRRCTTCRTRKQDRQAAVIQELTVQCSRCSTISVKSI